MNTHSDKHSSAANRLGQEPVVSHSTAPSRAGAGNQHGLKPVSITLTELPPSTNGLRKSFIKDGKVMSAKTSTYTKWRAAAVWEIAAQRPGKIDGPYRLQIRAQRHWRSKRARDIDNLIKPLSDALVKSGMVADDSLAESVYAEWSDTVQGVVCEVTPL